MVVVARKKLPRDHRGLLEQLHADDLVVEDWPTHVLSLYRTVQVTPPAERQLSQALAVWLQGPSVVAYNAPLLRASLSGLDEPSAQHVVENLAWHEYGHALSVTRATDELRRDGPRLLELLPPGLRGAVDYPGSYSRRQVFDEVIANLYPMMLGRAIRGSGYGKPEFVHPEVYEAFRQVLPWPPER